MRAPVKPTGAKERLLPWGIRRARLFLGVFLFLSAGVLGAQTGESPAPGPETGGPAAGAESAGDGPPSSGESPGGPVAGEEVPAGSSGGLTEEKVIELDIKTSTLPELAAWCRRLGISEGGGREMLAARLRNYYRLESPEPAEGGEEEDSGKPRQRIVIESARSTEYFTLDVVNEEYARLRGNVIISLADEKATHRISAQEILYNRTRNQVTARGDVSYVKEEGDTIETFRGESITVNLDSWATFLTEGISERALSGEATTYRFEGAVIFRSEEEVTILKNAEITNISSKNSYWSLNATKLWLLPGSDFALQNAVLKVGEIPVLYMPFFYLPADEVIFHPVLGYRSREGNFIQTTTYILGRPKPEDIKESSLTKILGSGSGMEKERQGIFLRSTGKKSVNPNDTTLKALFDLYANLGAYFGLDMKSPGIGILKDFELSTGLGRTRDIKALTEGDNPSYTPFPRSDGIYDWNRSQIFSWGIPLRYRFKTAGSLSGVVGDLSWELPYYSDPFVDRDFLQRAESMDWFNIIQQGAAFNETSTDNTLTSYEWRLNGRLGLNAPKVLSPYLKTLSLSSFSSTLMFNYRDSAKYTIMGNTYSPSRQFYFPDKFTIYSLSLNIGGTPLTLGNSNQTAAGQEQQEWEDVLWNIGTPRPPWEDKGPDSRQQSQDVWNLAPPVLSRQHSLSRSGGPQFTIDYRINPAAVSELQFRTGTDPRTGRYHWAEAEDVNWEDVSSVLSTVKGDADTSFTLSHPEGAFTTSFKLSGSGAYQNYLYTNREAEEFTGVSDAAAAQRVSAALNRIYDATFFTTSYDYSGTVKPLYQSQVWKNSSLSYSFRGLLAKSVFDLESLPQATLATPQEAWDAKPRWDIEYGAWDKDHLNIHELSTIFDANVMDKTQNLKLTLVLPPLDPSLAGNFTSRIWISEFNLSMRVLEPWEEEKRKLEPLYFTGTLNFGKLGFLKQYMAYDSEKNEYNTLTTTLSLWGFTASFTAIHSVPYEFQYDSASASGSGWIQSGDAQLHPQELRFGFNKSLPAKQFWKDRLSLAFNTNSSLFIDLQRYTYSKFDTTLGFTLAIKDVVDINLSATSENAVVYRYLRQIPYFDLPVATSGESNVFTDLLNSFRFDDEQLRTDSGFKLKSFNLRATHSMGDWNATLGVTLAPYLEQPSDAAGIPTYRFNTQISFVVQWLPISEIKSELEIDKDKWKVK